jgi:Mrp family chromosome partitioning ATPase
LRDTAWQPMMLSCRPKANLEKVNARILGVVLNGVPVTRNGGYYYYYYYYDETGTSKNQRRRRSTGDLPLSANGTTSGEGANV